MKHNFSIITCCTAEQWIERRGAEIVVNLCHVLQLKAVLLARYILV